MENNFEPLKYGQIILQNQNKKISMESDGKFKVDDKIIADDMELYHAFREFFGLVSHREAVTNLIDNPKGATD